MTATLQKNRPAAPPKGQREVDEIRQIAFSKGARITAMSSSGGKRTITITRIDAEPGDKQFRAMLYAIESVVRGQFDRGRPYLGLMQFTLKSRLIDVIVRCVQ